MVGEFGDFDPAAATASSRLHESGTSRGNEREDVAVRKVAELLGLRALLLALYAKFDFVLLPADSSEASENDCFLDLCD